MVLLPAIPTILSKLDHQWTLWMIFTRHFVKYTMKIKIFLYNKIKSSFDFFINYKRGLYFHTCLPCIPCEASNPNITLFDHWWYHKTFSYMFLYNTWSFLISNMVPQLHTLTVLENFISEAYILKYLSTRESTFHCCTLKLALPL